MLFPALTGVVRLIHDASGFIVCVRFDDECDVGFLDDIKPLGDADRIPALLRAQIMQRDVKDTQLQKNVHSFWQSFVSSVH